MAAVNKVILIGNLGRDPEMRYLPNGDAVVNLSIATTEKFKDKHGETQEHTEWHRVGFFGRLAEVCGEYLKKGAPIYVEGSLRTRKWTDKQGVERYVTEIRGDTMQMLGGRPAQRDDAPPAPAPMQAPAAPGDYARASGGGSTTYDDIPF